MITNTSWLDFAGMAAVVALVYGVIRLYVSWWVGSGRAARTWVKINTGKYPDEEVKHLSSSADDLIGNLQDYYVKVSMGREMGTGE